MRDGPDRRAVIAAGLACAVAANARAAVPAGRRLAFEVWRGGHRIGAHTLAFIGDDQNFAVRIDAKMAVSLGPIVLFRYHHQALETWRGGRFAELTSHTTTNGKVEHVDVVRGPGAVIVRTASAVHTLPPDALPLTHWNERALTSPLFNPQSGAAMREQVSRQQDKAGARYSLAGDANIVDWYDQAGVWSALKAKVKDGSTVDYRRVV